MDPELQTFLVSSRVVRLVWVPELSDGRLVGEEDDFVRAQTIPSKPEDVVVVVAKTEYRQKLLQVVRLGQTSVLLFALLYGVRVNEIRASEFISPEDMKTQTWVS